MTAQTSDTPEAAASVGFPPRYVRILGKSVSPDGANAFVLLGTNDTPDPYPYLVFCWFDLDEGGWSEGQSANADMWVPTGADGRGGHATFDDRLSLSVVWNVQQPRSW